MSALEGLRVLDFSTGTAGPVATMFLADFGADVIKIEGPTDDPARETPGYQVFNRNKRSIEVDPNATGWLLESVRGADVCVLGAGQELSDWGADIVAAAAANVGLIILRLPAYLDGATPWRGGQESSGLLAAAGGQARRQSSTDGGPIASISPHVLYVHGVWAAASVTAALVERTVSGQGQTVTVTGINAVMIATIGTLATDPAKPDIPTNLGATGRHPTYRHFRCSDGRWVSCGALGSKFERAALVGLGLQESVLDDPRMANDTMRMLIPDNMFWVRDLIEAAFASRPSAHHIDMLRGQGIPCGVVQAREEWFAHEQIDAINMRVELADSELGAISMPGVAINLTKTPGAVVSVAPRRGQHNGIAAWPAKPVVALVAPRLVEGPLTGFRVLNTGTFVATPFAGYLLAELGADVIKVEPINGDPFRTAGYTYNRGMRSLAIDLRTSAGQKAFHQLAKNSDIVIDGMRPGVMAKLNIDYATLAGVNPEIVTMSLSAFGEGGPLGNEPGVDMVIQAMSGMMSSWGGPESEPVANTIAINDVTTAAMSVLSCVLGLYVRQTTGAGQRVWDSLAGTSVLLQMESMVQYEGRSAAVIGYENYRGASAAQSHYATSDGWVCADNMPGVWAVADVPSAAELLAGTTGEAIAALEKAGLRATASRQVSTVLCDPELLNAEMNHIRTSDTGGVFMMTGRCAAFSRTQRRGPMDPPGTGEHTVAVLSESGLDSAEVDALLAADVVRTGGPMIRSLTLPYR